MIELLFNDVIMQFLSYFCVFYVENLKKNIFSCFFNILFIVVFLIFNLEVIFERNLLEFKRYGEEKLVKLVDYFSFILDIERLKLEWDYFKFMVLEIKQEYLIVSIMFKIMLIEWFFLKLISLKFYSFMFLNFVLLVELVQSIFVINVWFKRGGSVIKRIKIRLRNRFVDKMFDSLLYLLINVLFFGLDEVFVIIQEVLIRFVVVKERRKLFSR